MQRLKPLSTAFLDAQVTWRQADAAAAASYQPLLGRPQHDFLVEKSLWIMNLRLSDTEACYKLFFAVGHGRTSQFG